MAMKTIAHYEILELIGRGGMGEVYRARDTRLDRIVALKLLPASMTVDADTRKRFEREAQAAAALSHSNIVTVHELGEHEGRVFIVMEMVEGDSLRRLIDERPLAIDRALDIAIQLAEGLTKAHARDVIHRDIKPENVVVDSDGRAKLLDFGLAKLKGASRLTATTSTVGTLHYMSPEQAAGNEVDRRTDVWSLGVVLYEMIAGEAPFRADHAQAVLYSVTNQPHAPLTGRRTNVPLELERIVDKMLAKRPEERYPGMDDLLVDLRRVRAAGSTVLPPRPHRRSHLRRTFALVLAGAAIAAVAWFVMHREPPVAEAQSIAVLPFKNLSDQTDDDYFSDGLSEELLDALARVEGLHVAARTSSFQFKDRTGDVAEIGKQLNVATILEGSVRRSGNRVRITAQLVSTKDGFHLWSNTYDRELADVFAIQEDIAQRVVGELKVKLLAQGSEQLSRRPTDNLQAYDAYLLGKHHIARRTSVALNQAVEYFKKAIALDPNFALAHVGLADSYFLLTGYGNLSTTEALPLMEPALEKALKLDDRLGEAYASLGQLRLMQDRFAESETAFQKAIELSPSYAIAYHWFGRFVLSISGDYERGMTLIRKAVELDPLSPIINYSLAVALAETGKFDEAHAQFRRVIELDPAFPNAYDGIADIEYQEYGRIEEALGWIEKAIERDPGNLNRRIRRAHFKLGAGRTEEALEDCRAVMQSAPNYADACTAMGELYRGQGQLSEALRWFRKAAELDPENHWRQAACFEVLLDMGDDRAAEAWIPRLSGVQSQIARSFLHVYRNEISAAEKLANDVASQAGGPSLDWVARFDMMAGRYAEARARYARVFPDLVNAEAPRVRFNTLVPAKNLGAALLHTGESERGQMLLAECARFVETRPVTQRRLDIPTHLVEIYALQGRPREALEEFRQLVDAGWRRTWYWFILSPNLESIRGTPEFDAIVEQLRAEVARERALVTADERAPL